MEKLGLVIIDDERSARDLLRNLLEELSWVEILDEADNADEALPIILKRSPDVILLDIQMPRKDGFVLVESLMKHRLQVEVIFITAYERYAIRAIKASAFDYLLKPVRKTELILSLEKLMKKVESGKSEDRFSELIMQLSKQSKIKFRNRTGFSMIDADEILYCQADSNYTILELDSGKSLTVSMNLGKVEETLPENSFCRISRSLIVNIKYLSEVDRKAMTCKVVSSSSHVLSISKKFLRTLEHSCDKLFILE